MSCQAHNLSLRDDPSKTLEIRRNFLREIRRRFRAVRGAIRKTIGYENDAFGLSTNLEPDEAYDFPTDEAKQGAFIASLKEWMREGVLEPSNFSEIRNGDHWTAEYLRNAYVKAQNVAVGRLQQQGVSTEAPDVSELLTTRTSLKTLREIYVRTYEDLRDITEDTADVIREELTEGFSQGENPRKMADRITSKVESIQKTRAETLARTETIEAATNSAMDRYEQEGFDLVSHGDWQTAMDTDVCPFCRRLQGERFKISEFRQTHAVRFRGTVYRLNFPAHPNGRCFPDPVIGDPGDLAPLAQRVPGTLLS